MIIGTNSHRKITVCLFFTLNKEVSKLEIFTYLPEFNTYLQKTVWGYLYGDGVVRYLGQSLPEEHRADKVIDLVGGKRHARRGRAGLLRSIHRGADPAGTGGTPVGDHLWQKKINIDQHMWKNFYHNH